MKLGGVPNDVLTNLNPLSLVVMIPVLDGLVYPFLRKLGVRFTPIKKITAGYFVAASAMVWACVIQAYIYMRSPCGHYASADGCPHVDISVWAQSGSYVLIAISEILASITSLEYAHSKAPANMRSMVQAFSLFTTAVSSAIGFALVSLSSVSLGSSVAVEPWIGSVLTPPASFKDPLLVWNYGVTAGLAVFGGTCFWFQFRSLDKEEDHLNMLPKGQFTNSSSTDPA
jgi:proton-dependent oligopeptide transporter, POT family